MEVKEKSKYEEKKKAEAKREQSRYDPSQVFINPNQLQCQSSAFHYKPSEIYDIDQFLVSSKHFPNDLDSE